MLANGRWWLAPKLVHRALAPSIFALMICILRTPRPVNLHTNCFPSFSKQSTKTPTNANVVKTGCWIPVCSKWLTSLNCIACVLPKQLKLGITVCFLRMQMSILFKNASWDQHGTFGFANKQNPCKLHSGSNAMQRFSLKIQVRKQIRHDFLVAILPLLPQPLRGSSSFLLDLGFTQRMILALAAFCNFACMCGLGKGGPVRQARTRGLSRGLLRLLWVLALSVLVCLHQVGVAAFLSGWLLAGFWFGFLFRQGVATGATVTVVCWGFEGMEPLDSCSA